jgi:hypothetical protein
MTKDDYKNRMKAANTQEEVNQVQALGWWHHDLKQEERSDLIRQHESDESESSILSIWKTETLWR